MSSQRAIIHHVPHHGYGVGVSSRYFDKATYGLGLGVNGQGYGSIGAGYLGGARYLGAGYLGGYGGNAYDGIDNLGLAYNNYDLAGGRLGLGLDLGPTGLGLGGVGLAY